MLLTRQTSLSHCCCAHRTRLGCPAALILPRRIFPGYDRPAGGRLRRGGKGAKGDESGDAKEALNRTYQEVDDEQTGDDPHERVDLGGLALDELDERVGHEAHADADGH